MKMRRIVATLECATNIPLESLAKPEAWTHARTMNVPGQTLEVTQVQVNVVEDRKKKRKETSR